MSRYQPLAEFLAAKKGTRWEASFAEVERQLGFPLPKSAHRHPAWWANQSGSGHSQTAGWRSVGWKTAALDLERKRVRFEREHMTGATVDAALLERATQLTGIDDRDALLGEALKALIAREAALRLIGLGGTMTDYRTSERERSSE